MLALRLLAVAIVLCVITQLLRAEPDDRGIDRDRRGALREPNDQAIAKANREGKAASASVGGVSIHIHTLDCIGLATVGAGGEDLAVGHTTIVITAIIHKKSHPFDGLGLINHDEKNKADTT
ncbi:unnamed protein product [Owenia fusiformis]|uniref:Uncharacterized protein n=1 Tax=Owenia fusiformis TaxID=6347 RepID=A0A8J1UB75_OWEFU|nr:unnamed protein product [Owenia fusiformis]